MKLQTVRVKVIEDVTSAASFETAVNGFLDDETQREFVSMFIQAFSGKYIAVIVYTE